MRPQLARDVARARRRRGPARGARRRARAARAVGPAAAAPGVGQCARARRVPLRRDDCGAEQRVARAGCPLRRVADAVPDAAEPARVH